MHVEKYLCVYTCTLQIALHYFMLFTVTSEHADKTHSDKTIGEEPWKHEGNLQEQHSGVISAENSISQSSDHFYDAPHT